MAGLLSPMGPTQIPGLLGLSALKTIPLLGGLSGSTASKSALGGNVAPLLDPAAMRRAQMSRFLTEAGLAMMNPDPHGPPDTFGSALGRSLSAGYEGAQRGKQE